jgi:16S rRNA processing protein RimM
MTSDKQQSRVLLGEIAGVHGIRGDVLVRSYTAEPDAIVSYGPLTDAAGTRRFVIAIVRVTDKGIVGHVKGVDDRTAAEALRGTKLFVERALLPMAKGSEFYHADLIGLKAVAADGTPLGKIVSVQNFGAGDLLELEPATGAPTDLIPFQHQWVPAVDLDAGTVTINRPPESSDDGDRENGDDGQPVADED